MRTNKFGEVVYDRNDLVNFILEGQDLASSGPWVIDHDIGRWPDSLERVPRFASETQDLDPRQYHQRNQSQWHMPQQYRDLDIAKHVLDRCQTPEELQRAGQELLLFQERDMFDLLRYLCYLVDVMKENKIIWGVGRGSSVSSFVLYLLGVHRINSLFYDLDITEFLR